MIAAIRAAKSSAGLLSALLLSSSLAGAQASPAQPKDAAPAASDPAQPSRAECLDAHRNAQELKHSGKLLEAQSYLGVCSSVSCPGVVITDCGSWIGELEQLTPSMTFDIRADGSEALEAKVFVDDQPVTDRSHAFKVNPGRHVVRVELPPFEPRVENVVFAEGQRMRVISVAFASKQPAPAAPAPAAPAPPPVTVRPTPVIVYPLFVLGVAGLGSFGAFSVLGKSEQSKLEDECEPRCTDAELKAMKRWYMIGDISAGVGAAALFGAAIVYFTRPTEEVPSPTALSVSVGRVGLASSGESFGVTAARAW